VVRLLVIIPEDLVVVEQVELAGILPVVLQVEMAV